VNTAFFTAALLQEPEQRDAYAGLRFRELSAFEIRARADRGIEDALLDPEMRVVGVFGRQEERRAAGKEGRRRRHVRLPLHLAFDANRRLALGVDVADAKIRLGLLQLQLREPWVRVDGGLLQGCQLQAG